tara:strand:+ start:878 stop:1069 length:192 start_codon:yes stop_codon:yes gene_type:complete
MNKEQLKELHGAPIRETFTASTVNRDYHDGQVPFLVLQDYTDAKTAWVNTHPAEYEAIINAPA